MKTKSVITGAFLLISANPAFAAMHVDKRASGATTNYTQSFGYDRNAFMPLDEQGRTELDTKLPLTLETTDNILPSFIDTDAG